VKTVVAAMIVRVVQLNLTSHVSRLKPRTKKSKTITGVEELSYGSFFQTS
jgi:hypothetical protein